MLRSERPYLKSGTIARRLAAGSIATLMISLAGCSADIGRFGGSGLGFNNGDQRTPPATQPLAPAEPMRQPSYAPPRDAGLPPSREPPVRMSGLPEPTSRPDAFPPPAPSALPAPAVKARPAPIAPPRASAPVVPAPVAQPAAITSKPGETIEVQQGDTLYAISRRHRVAISELMTLNNLQNPNLRPGQKLVLPAGKRAVAARPVGDAPARTAAAPPLAAPSAPASPPSDWTGTYTLAQGDSLYVVARKHNVKSADLQSVNGITDPTKIRPGMVLKVPAVGGPAPETVATESPAPATGGPRIINSKPQAEPPKRVAALSPGETKSDAAPAAPPETPKASAASRFRWPVKGKVVANFGPRGDNTHNDGINISVPAGTEVHAVENGVVAYAGNELKGYGNLVLIRHENNWVSAYAHNDQLLVKRGDKIKRGQTVAKSGNTGAVDQPQVHFQLRQGSKPIDPLPHMEPN